MMMKQQSLQVVIKEEGEGLHHKLHMSVLVSKCSLTLTSAQYQVTPLGSAPNDAGMRPYAKG